MNLLGRMGLELVYVYNRPLVGDSSDAFEENGIAYRALSKADLELASSDPYLVFRRTFWQRSCPGVIFAVAHSTATNWSPMHGAAVWKRIMFQG